MEEPLRVLLVEDSADDAELVALELRRGGLSAICERVDSAETMRAALERGTWDVVLSDYVMPRFSGLEALRLVRSMGLDLPFILVSGAIPDETAIALMKAGSHDYLPKQNLSRLVPAVRRELADAHVRHERRQAREALRFLSEASVAFAASLDYPSTLACALRLAVPGIAEWCLIDVVEDDGSIHRVSSSHAEPDKDRLLRRLVERYPLDRASRQPAAEVLRTGRALLLPTIDAAERAGRTFDAEHALLLEALGSATAMTVPMVTRGRTVGVMSLASGPAAPRFGVGDLALAEEFALRCALAIENAQLYRASQADARRAEDSRAQLEIDILERKRAEEELGRSLEREREARAAAEEAHRRAAFLADASRLLAASLDDQTTLEKVSHVPVPAIADWCLVTLVDEDGRLRVAAAAHADPAEEAELEGLRARTPTARDAVGDLAEVIRTGRAILRPEISHASLEEGHTDRGVGEVLRLRFPVKSYLCVPLVARGRILGALSLAICDSSRRYGPADLQLAEELAHRTAQAIDNATLYREAREAIRVRDDFLSVASHELRTPLTALKLQVQTFLRGRASLPADVPQILLQSLDGTRRQVDRLSLLINNLLDVSRIAAGRLELARESVDLAEVARDVAGRFTEELGRAGCRLDFRASGPLEGQWDGFRLEQILTNLISNAIKFGAAHPIAIELRGDLQTATLTVRDEGIGIDAIDVERIFGRFERAVSVRHYGGLGLGLYITRQIVLAHGGSIRVESRPGAGSTFTVELPRQAPEADPCRATLPVANLPGGRPSA